MQGQHLAADDRVENPVGQGDSELRHPAAGRLPDDPPPVDQAEPFGNFLLAGLDVRADTRAAQSVEGAFQLLISSSVGVAVSGHQQVIGFQVERFLQFHACVHFGDELADAVNQDVFVVDGGEAQGTGHNGNFHALMLVFSNMDVWLGGEREDGMLHRSHVVLGHGIRHIANEEILNRVAVRQERGAGEGVSVIEFVSCYYP